MGLAHPHDTGGGSSVMHGVQTNGVPGDDGGAGDFDLNQGVNTMMSYNDGWEKSPYGQADTNNEGYGWLGSLMALDIAVIQDKYGVNEDWATGNNTYVLKDVNEWGVYIDSATGQPAVHNATNQATTRDGYYQGQSTYYSSIWDAGGIDQITYSGARNTNIDLRAATLQYEYGGAGWMSYATGIYGGFTIANGVTIENATSGSGNDTIIGNAANNVLHGGGGVDMLTGLAGNDTYYTDVSATQVFEAVGGGNDILYTSVNYTLGANSEVETLSANSYAATTALSLTGNYFNNKLIGNAGNNSLHGAGGTDLLYGLGGNDTYYTDVATTQVFEAAGGGTDALYTSVSYTLGGGQEIETLSANNHAATSALNLTGNSLNQTVVGNAGNNVLHGGGGTDVLVGFGGNDIYYTDVATTSVDEGAGGGNDQLYTSVSYTLGSASEVELLSTNSYAAATAINLTGNSIANTILGNAGNNVLDGKGGNDQLIGFGGADTFAFSSALGAGNVDTVSNFESGNDKIGIDDAIFTAAGGLGALNANAFFAGAAAHDADDRIIYNAATGQLFYDADGNGAGAAVQFASLNPAVALVASDFLVI
jgi:Ca2+-binding RTX toxin-like protein